MNCTIVIEQKEGARITQDLFAFDDYRVATAIANLLCNIEGVKSEHSSYKTTLKG